MGGAQQGDVDEQSLARNMKRNAGGVDLPHFLFSATSYEFVFLWDRCADRAGGRGGCGYKECRRAARSRGTGGSRRAGDSSARGVRRASAANDCACGGRDRSGRGDYRLRGAIAEVAVAPVEVV